MYLALFFTIFGLSLFLFLYTNNWFDLFINGGFNALYDGDK